MFINKMGSNHFNYGVNNQDSGFEYKNILCVVDGCSGGKHSEIGAKLFAKKLQQKCASKEEWQQDQVILTMHDITEVFEEVMNFVVNKTNKTTYNLDMTNFMCFTIMICQKIGIYWHIGIFGDGVIITQNQSDQIEFIDINHSNTPYYLAYTYIDDENLQETTHLNQYVHKMYNEIEFKSIGIASDGLSYVINSNYENQFKELIKEKKPFKIKRFINKLNYQFKDQRGFFKDDITIAMR